MTFDPNAPKPTWSDPAATTQVPTQETGPLTPGSTSATPQPGMVAPIAPVTPVAAPAPPPRKSGAWLNLLLGVAALIAVGGIAFAIGRTTAPTSAASINGFPNGGNFALPNGSFDPNASFDPNNAPGFDGNGPGGFFGGGGATLDGKVTAISGDSMTITLDSGNTVTVKTNGDTTYHASSPATAADVTVGADVAVRVSGGGRFTFGGPNASGGTNGNGGPNGATQDLTASDVTVSR